MSLSNAESELAVKESKYRESKNNYPLDNMWTIPKEGADPNFTFEKDETGLGTAWSSLTVPATTNDIVYYKICDSRYYHNQAKTLMFKWSGLVYDSWGLPGYAYYEKPWHHTLLYSYGDRPLTDPDFMAHMTNHEAGSDISAADGTATCSSVSPDTDKIKCYSKKLIYKIE